MHVILMYDITDDRIRLKIADACQDYGLDRTQFSAFIGELSRSLQDELTLRVQTLLGDRPGAILLVPVNGPEWARRWELRNERDPSESAPPPPSSTPPRSLADEPF